LLRANSHEKPWAAAAWNRAKLVVAFGAQGHPIARSNESPPAI